jgi:hypothetical protein
MEIMSIKQEVAWPARRVWSVVSDFGGLKAWNPAVLECTTEGAGVGSIRTFVTRAATVKERIEALDDAGMRIDYSIVSGSTLKVRDGRLAITVRPIDAARAELTWSLSGEPEGASPEALREQTERRYLGRVDDLRHYLGTTASSA